MDLQNIINIIDGSLALGIAIWFFNKQNKDSREDISNINKEKESLQSNIDKKDDVIFELVTGLRDETIENQKIFSEMTEVLNSVISKGEKSEDRILQEIANQTREVKRHVSLRLASLAKKKIDLKELMDEDYDGE